MIRLCVLLIVLLVPARALAQSDAGTTVFAGQVPIVRTSNAPIDPSKGVRITIAGGTRGLYVELGRRLLFPKVPAPGAIEVVLRRYPAARDPVQPRHREPSFLVDYDEPDVEALHARVQRELGPSPTMPRLARFVHAYIREKDLNRGFDPASVTVRLREGDCTEHAVLLTALARSFGFAARLTSGIVILEDDGRIGAFLHMWVEWNDRGRWVPSDAALRQKVLYLPTGVMRDEGPGYARDPSGMDGILVTRLTVEPL